MTLVTWKRCMAVSLASLAGRPAERSAVPARWRPESTRMFSPVIVSMRSSVTMISAISSSEDSRCSGAWASALSQPACERSARALGGAGRDGVDQDAVRRELQREGARHEVHRRLAGEVGQVVEVGRLVGGPVAEEDEVAARRAGVVEHGARGVQGEQEGALGAGDAAVPGGGVQLSRRTCGGSPRRG